VSFLGFIVTNNGAATDPEKVKAIGQKKIQELLKNCIIQESKSLYNNPIWVVDKKGTDEAGN